MTTRLTVHRLKAIIGALDFVIAGEFDADSHERPIADYEAARDWACDELCKRETLATDRLLLRQRL